MENEKNVQSAPAAQKRIKVIIIVVAVVALLALMIIMIAPKMADNSESGERETYPPLDPSELYETKEEGFDIMEYEEYLKYDRNIYYSDTHTGVTISLDDSSAQSYGQGVKITYALLKAIIAGDSDTYNSYVSEDVGHYDSFTQQQLYDIKISRYSEKDMSSGGRSYREIVVKVEYKIHENNGTFRNNLESDSSRPQYYVINDSTGEFMLMDVIEITFVKK